MVADRVPGEALVADRGPHARADGADGPRIGVLALQGDVLEHLRLLGDAGAHAVPFKRPGELEGLDGVLLPGGESTTIGKLAELSGLLEPLRARIADGLPAFGTCAGAILLAHSALDDQGRAAKQPLLGCLDAVVRRNAFGRQVASFEGPVEIAGIDGGPMHAVFIRAPWFEEVGADVEVLATVETPVGVRVVVVQQEGVLASAFHPELAGDGRLHRRFVEQIIAAAR